MACLPQKDSPSSAAWARQGSVAGQNVHFQGKGKVAQSHLTLCDPVDHTVHGILQAGILVTIPFSRGPSDRGTEPRPPSLQSEPLGGCWAPGPMWVDLLSAASDGAQPQAESELALGPRLCLAARAPRSPDASALSLWCSCACGFTFTATFSCPFGGWAPWSERPRCLCLKRNPLRASG